MQAQAQAAQARDAAIIRDLLSRLQDKSAHVQRLEVGRAVVCARCGRREGALSKRQR